MLEKFNIYLGKLSNLRRKIVSSLTYPAILLLFMIAMVLVISIFVIPKFASFFEDLEAQLPALTLLLHRPLTQFLRENIVLFTGVAAAALHGRQTLLERFDPQVIIIDQLKIKTALPWAGSSMKTPSPFSPARWPS